LPAIVVGKTARDDGGGRWLKGAKGAKDAKKAKEARKAKTQKACRGKRNPGPCTFNDLT
jgi:hypothetical protein